MGVVVWNFLGMSFGEEEKDLENKQNLVF